MKVRKILFINRRLSVGWAERVMTLLANATAKRGIETDMVVLQDMERTYQVDEKVNIIQFKHEKYNPIIKAFKRIMDLRHIMRKGKYDAVVVFMHVDGFYTIISQGFKKENLIISERNDPRRFKQLYVKIGRKLLYPLASKFVFQTEDAMNCFPENIRKKSYVISNPINENLPEPYTGERDKEVIAIGRLVSQKNFPMAINAFEKFYNKNPEYKFTIYGDGPLRESLEKTIKEKELENVINLPGFSKNIIEDIKKAGIYISSSDFEGISNAMLEAMAMGIPTVCTDCPIGGAKMTIKNNENGVLVPVGDEDALYRAMDKVANDSTFAKEISENAIKIRKELSIDKILDKWIDVMER